MYKLRWMFFSASEVRIVSLNYMYLYFALNDKAEHDNMYFK